MRLYNLEVGNWMLGSLKVMRHYFTELARKALNCRNLCRPMIFIWFAVYARVAICTCYFLLGFNSCILSRISLTHKAIPLLACKKNSLKRMKSLLNATRNSPALRSYRLRIIILIATSISVASMTEKCCVLRLVGHNVKSD